MIKRALPKLALTALFASTNLTVKAQSKGDQALLDALVRKGVLTLGTNDSTETTVRSFLIISTLAIPRRLVSADAGARVSRIMLPG
jgi:hypothetical protein